MKLLVGVYGFAVYTHPPKGLHIHAGPWWSRVNWPPRPPYEFRYANGSRWFSGWHRWADGVEL